MEKDKKPELFKEPISYLRITNLEEISMLFELAGSNGNIIAVKRLRAVVEEAIKSRDSLSAKERKALESIYKGKYLDDVCSGEYLDSLSEFLASVEKFEGYDPKKGTEQEYISYRFAHKAMEREIEQKFKTRK